MTDCQLWIEVGAGVEQEAQPRGLGSMKRDGLRCYCGVDRAWLPCGTAIKAVGFAPVG